MSKAKLSMVKKPRKSAKSNAVSDVVSKVLLTDVNDDCLTEVFKYLDTNSLLKVNKLGGRLRGIVTDRVIRMKTVNFSQLTKEMSLKKLFSKLGGSMTKIQICSDDIQMTAPNHSPFMEFLRLLICYGQPGQLKKMVLEFGKNEYTKVPLELLIAVKPFLENVHTLQFKLQAKPTNNFFEQFMEHFPKENLSTLVLDNAIAIGDWMKAESMPKLREFHLSIVQNSTRRQDDLNHANLMQFIGGKPSLHTFNYEGKNSEAIFNAVAMHIPDVERLGMVKNLSVPMDDGDDFASHRNNIRNKWSYLKAFGKLKNLSLTSYAVNFSNCGEVFRTLADNNTVECLELSNPYAFQKHHNPVMVADLKRFTSLKTLDLCKFKSDADEFVGNLYDNLSGLDAVKFSGDASVTQATIIKAIQRVRILREVDIACKFRSFSAVFYKKLLKVRKEATLDRDGPIEPLVIHLNYDMAKTCIEDLGNKYDPSIITLKAKAS